MTSKQLYGLTLIAGGLYLSWYAGEAVGHGIGALLDLDDHQELALEDPVDVVAEEPTWLALQRLERRRLELEVARLEREAPSTPSKRVSV